MSFATDDAAESQISVPVTVMHVGSSEETVSETRVIPETADGCRVLAPCRGTRARNRGRQAEKPFKRVPPSYFTRQRPQARYPGRSSSPSLVLIEGAEAQQVLDILAREAQGLPYARAGQDAVLDEAVNRRGVHLQVSGQVLDREQQLEPQTLSSLASCESLLFWLFGMPPRASCPGRHRRCRRIVTRPQRLSSQIPGS